MPRRPGRRAPPLHDASGLHSSSRRPWLPPAIVPGASQSANTTPPSSGSRHRGSRSPRGERILYLH